MFFSTQKRSASREVANVRANSSCCTHRLSVVRNALVVLSCTRIFITFDCRRAEAARVFHCKRFGRSSLTPIASVFSLSFARRRATTMHTSPSAGSKSGAGWFMASVTTLHGGTQCPQIWHGGMSPGTVLPGEQIDVTGMFVWRGIQPGVATLCRRTRVFRRTSDTSLQRSR
jgi:hypothetical protein